MTLALAEPGQSPRQHPRYRERGRARRFTWPDIAAVLGLTLRTAQQYAAARRFDPRDLRSIWAYGLERSGLPAALRLIAALPCGASGGVVRLCRRRPCPSCIAHRALQRAGLTNDPPDIQETPAP